jgi:lysophospholipase L1-like esterase
MKEENMPRFRNFVFFVVLTIGSVSFSAENKTATDLRLTLPPVFYAVPGVEMNIYYDNIVCTETPEKYTYKFKCPIGTHEERRWTVTPKPTNTGDFKIAVTVSDEKGKMVDKGKTLLRVVPADAGAGKEIKILIIGDSLTAGGVYAAEVARLLSLPGNPTGKTLGTRKTGGKGVAHEGYGGWRWETFASKYDPNPDMDNPDPKKRRASSPFIFLGKDGKPELDVPRYFKEKCDGEKPDCITVMLGINDCFGASMKCEDEKAVDAIIDTMFKNAEVLLAAFRKAAPKADIGICLTTPPNSRESGFVANYQGKPHRWQWKQAQHRLVQRQLEHFGKREKERIYIVPTELNLDPVDGYPDNNGVHPNADGYKQIGASIYAWLKWRLQSR